MQTSTFRQRLRQLIAADKNAVAIYSDLASRYPDVRSREIFKRIAKDEARHVKIAQAILAMVEP
jgi:rubrerythrin